MKRTTITIIAAIALSGCAVLQPWADAWKQLHPDAMSPRDIAFANDFELCDAFARSRSATFETEVTDRALFPADEWPAVQGKQIYVGMTELGMICAVGLPRSSGRVARFSDPGGATTQYFYRYGFLGFHDTYVYARGGRIIAIDRL